MMWSRSRSWAFRSAIWASRAFRRVRSAVMMLLSVSVAGGGGGSGAAASGWVVRICSRSWGRRRKQLRRLVLVQQHLLVDLSLRRPQHPKIAARRMRHHPNSLPVQHLRRPPSRTKIHPPRIGDLHRQPTATRSQQRVPRDRLAKLAHPQHHLAHTRTKRLTMNIQRILEQRLPHLANLGDHHLQVVTQSRQRRPMIRHRLAQPLL